MLKIALIVVVAIALTLLVLAYKVLSDPNTYR